MLVSMVETMGKAREGMYCIPALSAANEITVKAAIETAEEKNAPLIMLYMHTSKNPQDMLDYGYMATRLAERATVPVSIILDHGPNFETCMLAIRAGFSDVMLDKSSLPYEQNRDEVAAVVKVAHAVGVGVEAELGHVGTGDKYDQEGDTVFTRPDEAVSFLQESGADTLAVSVGTSHGVYKGTPKINFELLDELHRIVPAPLVIHGGSGTGEDNLYRMCRMGANKLNIANELMQGCVKGVETNDCTGFGAYGFFNYIHNGYKEVAAHMFDLCGATGQA